MTAVATNGGEKKKPRVRKTKDKNTKKKRTRKKTKKSNLMRRNIRHLITDENLTETTKEARVSKPTMDWITHPTFSLKRGTFSWCKLGIDDGLVIMVVYVFHCIENSWIL